MTAISFVLRPQTQADTFGNVRLDLLDDAVRPDAVGEEELEVLRPRGLAGSPHRFEHRVDRVPDVAPCLAAGPSQVGRMLRVTQERNVGKWRRCNSASPCMMGPVARVQQAVPRTKLEQLRAWIWRGVARGEKVVAQVGSCVIQHRADFTLGPADRTRHRSTGEPIDMPQEQRPAPD